MKNRSYMTLNTEGYTLCESNFIYTFYQRRRKL